MAQTPIDKSIQSSDIKIISKGYVPVAATEPTEKKILPLPTGPMKFDSARNMFFYGTSLDELSSNSIIQQKPLITDSAVTFSRKPS